MKDSIQASVAIITKNSGATLLRALESVRRFSEIIVADGGSTDTTLEIARSANTIVIRQNPAFLDEKGRIIDFSGVRNQTYQTSSHNWFLYIDADETLSPEATEEIRSIIEKKNSPAAYWIPRLYTIKGICVQCSASYPNRQIRFFHKHAVSGFRKPIHERPEIVSGAAVLTLTHPILVPADLSEDERAVKNKMLWYIELELGRHAPFTAGVLTRIIGGSLRSIGRLLLKSIMNGLFCRGVRLPFSAEMRPALYSLFLIRESLKRFFSL